MWASAAVGMDGPASSGPDDGFQLCKAQFNRVEIWTVRWQIPKRGAGAFDERLHALDVMRGEVVRDPRGALPGDAGDG